ncbi:hypothetical protein ASG43_07720 [Aureimonas sp. Leaf454]|uniref:heparan-alpha-glucosaminide N-acetyltransferase n=1 Tax=Aureimonas sp. Leaf454 TaxID=1736381 RepID=UPI0006F30A98|nr:heparan-alpha-glucosaminide N-acetyltransferase [Aureimonas sp. Leaf454]KQT49023.1 hypothetical protein ASG43_07720 [Aureimonas sp. Leaf454]
MTKEAKRSVSPGDGRRIEALDVARGVALLAMAIFHFTWDLDNFGYVARGLAGEGGWRLFARCIASSFLVLVGTSLVLAHARGIRWRPFFVRLGQVAAGALAITVVTFFVTPGSFVFFGILHHIAVASLLGLLALRLPWFATALAAVVVVALPTIVRSASMEPMALAWIGFAETPPITNDFVPIFPWFGAVLAGMALAQLGQSKGAVERLRALNPALSRLRPLAFLGRHSLAFYLIHQPLLFGLVFLATQVAPPDRTALLDDECRRSAIFGASSAEMCPRFAACAASRLSEAGILEAAIQNRTTPEQAGQIQTIVSICAQSSP